jgi:para-nitrobenzyl esterase
LFQQTKERKLRKILIAAMIANPTAILAGSSPAIAEAAAPAGFSVETTDLGTLLDNPGAKAVLVKHLPDLVSNEQIQMARSMTLKQLQGFAGDALTDAKLAAIQADLNKLPK